jgi:hypothetical protein
MSGLTITHRPIYACSTASEVNSPLLIFSCNSSSSEIPVIALSDTEGRGSWPASHLEGRYFSTAASRIARLRAMISSHDWVGRVFPTFTFSFVRLMCDMARQEEKVLNVALRRDGRLDFIWCAFQWQNSGPLEGSGRTALVGFNTSKGSGEMLELYPYLILA